MTRFRAATYNVHKFRGMDWRVNPERILSVIEKLDADVIALQEVFAPQAEYLAARLQMQLAFGATKDVSGIAYGNSLLSRLAITAQRNHTLTIRGREPRACLQTELVAGAGRSFAFFAVHLGTSYTERRKQAALLLSPEVLAQPAAKGRRMVAGDFNEWTRGLATRMLSEHLQSADLRTHIRRKKTYPGMLPLLHLDHFYYDEMFHLAALQLHRTTSTLAASDHLPLTADFDLR